MNLEDIGYNKKIDELIKECQLSDFEIGRVISEHKERYIVFSRKGELNAEITGNLRFTADSREDFPAIGDWVAITIFDSQAIIQKILPRFSILNRQAIQKFGEQQIIATNIDYALLIQAIDRDFNVNRLERYITICNSAKVEPIIVLTKIDLISPAQTENILNIIKKRITNIPIVTISNETKQGFENLNRLFEQRKTYCMLGSSGVGKSSLLNNLSEKQMMKTDSISQSSNRGKHITSHREMFILKNKSILIDNPGMREVGITNSENGLKSTFELIDEIAKDCKYKNCSHTIENECSVIKAVKNGEIDKESYKNFIKLEKEKAYFEQNIVEKRKKDKQFGKKIKNFKKDIQKLSDKHNNSFKK